MRTRIVARKTHKWLGLLVGLQVVVWSLTGLYMTVVHLDIIHGDHLVRPEPVSSVDLANLLDPVAVAVAKGAHGARLVWLRGRPAYLLSTETGEETLVDAVDGVAVPPPNEADIRSIARSTYTGTEEISSAALITQIPGEIRGRRPPLWRVEFDQWNRPTLYFSPVTGELVTRRHELWRIFDFAWMLHVMGYEDRDNVNNIVLRVFTSSALLLALSGAWLLLFAFPRKKKKASR